MNFEESAEELLEKLWISSQEEGKDSIQISDADGVAVEQLISQGAIDRSGNTIMLTVSGISEARSVVRRHRLAERLLVDVLGSRDPTVHDHACKFEHLLDHGLDDSICALLGHPKVCPHGKRIPEGSCCGEKKQNIDRVVASLSELESGQKGKVAYIYAPEQEKLQKLMALGILPGAPIELTQRFPSYTFRSGNSQFAVDSEIADSIYVRLDAESAGSPDPTSNRVRRRKSGRRHGRDSERESIPPIA
jgi:DtxR family transcriptional regulator, Mn-dependent transcriptional regulator